MTISANFPNVQPSLLLDFANARQLPPQVTFTRATTATYYDGSTTALADQNLIVYSQDFSNGWTQDNVTLTGSQTAPDGTSTAWQFTETTNNGDHRCYIFPAQIGAPFYTASVYLKNGTRRYALLRMQTAGGSTAGAVFDLQGGTVSSTGGALYSSSSITSVGSGWYRCTVTSNGFSSGVGNFVVAMSNTSSYSDNIQYVGTGATMLVWGAQLEQRSTATAYIPTTTQAITNYIPVLLTAGGGQPRFDHNPTTSESLGLLIEDQRTNVAIYSSDFANPNWTQYNGGVITSNQMVAPDGTLTADRMDMTSTQYSGVYQSGPAGATGTCTISVWARVTTGTQTFNIGFYNGIQGAVMSSNLTATTSWQRFTFTATLSGVSNIHINNYTASAGTIYIWGAQVEQGAFATSYIPTTSASATRAADLMYYSGASMAAWFNNGEGTVFMDCVPNSSTGYLYAFSDGTGNNRWQVDVTNTSVGLYDAVGGNAQVSFGFGNITVGTQFKIAAAFQNSDFAATLNAGSVSNQTSGLVPPMTFAYIGTSADGNVNSMLKGWIKKFAYYPQRVTNAQLQALTS